MLRPNFYPGPWSICVAWNGQSDEAAWSVPPRRALSYIRVPGSRGKADNVNYAIARSRADVVAVFDADARPDQGAAAKAVAALASGADVVQGRNVVQGGHRHLAALVRLDFWLVYGATYPWRNGRLKFAYFCGSNGWWSRHALDQLGARPFDSDKATEDIDCSIRAHSAGLEIAYNEHVVCREAPPPNWRAWRRQRYRWARGWGQMSAAHLASLAVKSGPVRLRLLWIYLLGCRVIAAPIAFLALLLMLPVRVAAGSSALGATFVWVLVGCVVGCLLSLAEATCVTYVRGSSWQGSGRGFREDAATVLLWPAYTIQLWFMGVVALVMGWRRTSTPWAPTPRDPESVEALHRALASAT